MGAALDALLVNGSSWREIMFHIINTTKHRCSQDNTFFFANDRDHPSQFLEIISTIQNPDGPALCKEDGLLNTTFFANDIHHLHRPACFKKGSPVCTICLTLKDSGIAKNIFPIQKDRLFAKRTVFCK